MKKFGIAYLKIVLVLPLRAIVFAADYVDTIDGLATRIEDALDDA